MGKSAPSPPKAPDPAETAAAQAAANESTARVQAALNRVNQYTPYGNIEYTDLGDDRWKANVTLSPAQQAISDLREQGTTKYGQIANQALPRVGEIMSQDLDFDSLPPLDQNVTNRQRVEDALFSRMQPRLDAQRQELDTRLRNQGLTPGSDAWNRAWQEYSIGENDARLATISAAGTEQQRLYGMSADQRQRALQEMLASRQIPLNEAAALMAGTQVNYPTFSAVPQTGVAPTDVAGITNAAFNNQMALYNAQMQQQAGLYGGLASLGGSIISTIPFIPGISDRRVKENIHKIGETDNDLPIYLFNFKGDPRPQISVMAQDVEKRDPSAVHEVGGLKMVDLERAVLASRKRKGKAHV